MNFSDRKIKVGDIVRVKESVVSPKYKWGAVNHTNIGSVTNISPDGMECQVDFLQQSGWTGLVSEMELVGAAHTGIRFQQFIFCTHLTSLPSMSSK